jgi:hypothetical protein
MRRDRGLARYSQTMIVAAVLALLFTACGHPTNASACAPHDDNATHACTPPSHPPSAAPQPENNGLPTPPDDSSLSDFLAAHNVSATQVALNDPSTPAISIPVPPGWLPDSSRQPPAWAISYSGPGDGGYEMAVLAGLSRIGGDVDPPVDPQPLADASCNDARHLDSFTPDGQNDSAQFAGFPACTASGIYSNGRYLARRTHIAVAVHGRNGLYLLVIDADSRQEQQDAMDRALQTIVQRAYIAP